MLVRESYKRLMTEILLYDLKTRLWIGANSERDGLYYLDRDTSSVSTAFVLVFRLKLMRPSLKIALACFLLFHWFQYISSDELPEGPGIEWTCMCALSNFGTPSYPLGANCSTTCDCKPEKSEGDSAGAKWVCQCANSSVPTAASGRIHNVDCFTACNCTTGGASKHEIKHNSSKIVVYVLLVCVVLTTVAFLSSVGCYIYRKDRCPVQQSVFSSDKDSSWTSGTNLISHRSASESELQVNIHSCFNPIQGFLDRAAFVLRSKRTTIPGSIVHFSYFELEQATNKFLSDNLIGLGGSSNVYRGQLKDGRIVAVKKLKMQGGPDAEFEFLTEIEVLSRLHHCQIVPLIGYCSESQGRHVERLLVFEFMPNGNLRDCLDGTHGQQPLDWGTRVSIALGAARGLEYLHEAAAPRILHRDIKTTNILLDEKWRARITDLGMAKRLVADDVPSTSNSPARMLGTFGYFAPEYAIVGKASPKSDVFSFGVVLLELASGRAPLNRSSKKGEESLVIWATPRLLDSKRVISEIADPLLSGNFIEEEMLIMTYLARECLQMDPETRPTMSEVVQILSTIAPDKSKTRNFTTNFFQSSSCRSMKTASDVVEMPQHHRAGNSVSREEPRIENYGQASRRCSLPSTVERHICSGGQAEGDTVLSAEYMERLILISSKARSWRGPDDEAVDLTEPRLESFWQATVQSL